MARFCPECGAPLQPNQKYCSECGKAVPGTATPAPPAASHPPGVPADRIALPAPRSRLRRNLAFAGGGLALLALFVAGFIHLNARAPKTAEMPPPGPQLPAQGGAAPPVVQTPAATPPQKPVEPPTEVRHVTAKDGQCGLFTKAELTTVLGVTFTHATEDATGCTYKGDNAREWVRVEVLWTGGRRALQQRATAYDTLTKSNPKGWIPPFQPVPGMGDAAFVNLVNAVQVGKGDIAFTLDLRYFHDLSDPNALVPDSTKRLVNRALARL